MLNGVDISVIIPTLNSAKTLASCLDSLVNQTFKNIEVLIVDGVSTDDTIKIINQYKETNTYIKYISEPDKGIYDAMNKGIKKSVGNWLYFLGSDDTFYDDDVLLKIKTKIDKSPHKIIYGNVLMHGKNQWNLDNTIFNGEYDLPKMLYTNMCHQCIFYNRQVFNDFGYYDLNYKSSADQEFNLRCYANLSFEYLDIIVANFYVGGFSTTYSDNYFNQNRGAILYKYFKNKIFSKEFSQVRLYLKEAFFNANSFLKFHQKLICLMAYFKLKVMTFFS